MQNSSGLKKYDLAIALRVYPGISKQPIGNFQSKLEMFQVNLNSLLKALGTARAFLYLILDGCDERFEEFARSRIAPEDLKIDCRNGEGNEATFLLQIDWLLKQQYSEALFFAEDDYVYRPDTFLPMLQLLRKEADFISPHNHGDYYGSKLQHQLGTRLLFAEGLHWHLPASTCLTFLTRKEVLAATAAVFRTYARGNLDFTLFTVLTMPGVFRLPPLRLLRNFFFLKCMMKAWWMCPAQLISGRTYRLAVPVEAAGTHLQYDETGPGKNWETLISEYKSELARLSPEQ
jgi:hypothetical protein